MISQQKHTSTYMQRKKHRKNPVLFVVASNQPLMVQYMKYL